VLKCWVKVNGYIEKRRFFRDTPGENRGLRRVRRVQRKPMNMQQRKVLLNRLAIARKVRMMNLRRRK
jgi:hypothetical protein